MMKSSANPLTKRMTPDALEVQAMLDWLRKFAAARIDSVLYDARRSMSPDIILELGNHGFFGLQISRQYGGLALDWHSTVQLIQQVSAIDYTIATIVITQNFLGARSLTAFASSAVKDRMLPLFARGRIMSAFALTEPEAGSNPMTMRGMAVIQKDGSVRLSGTKMYIGNAAWCSVMLVFMRCQDTDGRLRGVSAFLIPRDTPGLQIGPELMTMGLRSMVQNMVRLDDVHVPADAVLGTHGAGMDIAHDAMMQTRIAIGAISLGGQQRLLQLLLRYATRRQAVSTGRLLDNALTLERVGYLTAMVRASSGILDLIAANLDQGKKMPAEFFIICKTATSEFAYETVDMTMQALGGRGYLENNLLPQMLRDARAARILDGPTETMEHYIGLRLLSGNEELLGFIADDLQCPDIRAELEQAIATAKKRAAELASPFSGRRKNDLMGAFLGNACSWAILSAALRVRFAASAHAEDARAIRWLAGRMKKAINRIVSASIEESIAISSEQLTELIGEYAAAIGDIEHRRMGEIHQLDPYLGINADDYMKPLEWQ